MCHVRTENKNQSNAQVASTQECCFNTTAYVKVCFGLLQPRTHEENQNRARKNKDGKFILRGGCSPAKT